MDTLNSKSISSLMKRRVKVLYYPEIDSTNNEAKRLIDGGHHGEMLLAAGMQTAGRGRQGKSFYSPDKTGVYMTLVLRPKNPPEESLSITSAAAVAVCRAIEALSHKRPQIKWRKKISILI